ncbi:MAG TPA: hypothetical protein DEF45_24545, partial [Rhodopirellula sp.]|nr:hypothetical protein [Rhodopirellula sp.]
MLAARRESDPTSTMIIWLTMMLRPSLMTLVLISSFHWSLGCQLAAAADDLTYEQHIRPIFRAHCFDCHGATEELEGELDLRQVR